LWEMRYSRAMNQWLRQKIQEIVGEGVVFSVLTPPDQKLGDYSTNVAFMLAKRDGKNPILLAQEVVGKFADDAAFEKVEAVNGYINFFLSEKLLENHSAAKAEERGKVIVEYSSPNIAKPMHIGHLRSTIIGDALANVYEALGYEVIRWNFIGDWGTQFGKLIAAYKKWGDKEGLEKHPVQEMLRLYVKFHEEMKSNPELEKEGQEEFRRLEEGDAGNKKIWEEFRNESLKEFVVMYAYLNLAWKDLKAIGESDYESQLKPLIQELERKNLTKESEGALIIELNELPPAMLRKSDGATLYFTRDLAALKDRIENYKAAKILYVVANQQALHFEQLFAVAHKLDWDKTELVHVKFGMVLGEDGKKLATREGKVIPLQEVIDEITEKAAKVVKLKNPDLKDEEIKKIAHTIGIGALKYNDLKQHPHTDITFDWEAMLDLGGNSGPYLQYTYARLANILTKAEGDRSTKLPLGFDLEGKLIERKMIHYQDVLQECITGNALSGLALYLYELAGLLNRFYEKVHVLNESDSDKRNARLRLIEVATKNLKNGLNLLGIQTLERI